MSHYYVHNHPNIKEGNPVLPEKPNAGQFLLQKTLTAPVIAANASYDDITFYNVVLTLVVLRNHYIYNTTPRCKNGLGGANYDIYGNNVNCT
jgi:hypothetical protein